MANARVSDKVFRVLARGLKCRCPRCGQFPIFQSWALLHEQCAGCGLKIREREDDTWFFMYMSTAAITGVFIILMLLVTPKDLTLGRIAIGLGSLLIFVMTNPIRKGLAIALDYLVDSHTEYPKHSD